MSSLGKWKSRILLFQFASTEETKGTTLYDDVVDVSWNPSDISLITSYLSCGDIIRRIPLVDPGVCPLCSAQITGGTIDEMTDGEWIWFNTLIHYVQYHHVRLPDRFVDEIRLKRSV